MEKHISMSSGFSTVTDWTHEGLLLNHPFFQLSVGMQGSYVLKALEIAA